MDALMAVGVGDTRGTREHQRLPGARDSRTHPPCRASVCAVSAACPRQMGMRTPLPGNVLRNKGSALHRRRAALPLNGEGTAHPDPLSLVRQMGTAREIGCAQAKLESVAGAYTWLAWSRDRGDHGWIHCLGERCRSITVEDLLRRDGVTESAAEGAV